MVMCPDHPTSGGRGPSAQPVMYVYMAFSQTLISGVYKFASYSLYCVFSEQYGGPGPCEKNAASCLVAAYNQDLQDWGTNNGPPPHLSDVAINPSIQNTKPKNTCSH